MVKEKLMTLHGVNIIIVVFLYIFNFIVNYNVIDTYFYGTWVALLFLILISVITLFGRVFHAIFSILILISASSALYFKFFYKIGLTEEIIFSGIVNDVMLTSELMSINLVAWVFCTAIIPIVILIRLKVEKTSIIHRVKTLIVTAIIAITWVAIIFSNQKFSFKDPGTIRDPKLTLSIHSFSPVDLIYFTKLAFTSYKKYTSSWSDVENILEKEQFSLAVDVEATTVVFILGETARADRWGINNYKLNTTPRLAETPNVFNFSNVKSCDTITVRSLACIFSRMTKKEHEVVPRETSFIEIFKSLGFSVKIFTLQNAQKLYHYFNYDQLVTLSSILKSSKNKEVFDKQLIPYLGEAVESVKENQIILLHTLGSHYAYHDRFAKEDAKFEPYCNSADLMNCTEKEISNAYDNTIYITDQFIAQVIEQLKGKKAVVFYTSDHGESLGENGHYFHGASPKTAPKEQFHVPMLAWLSPEFIATKTGNKVYKKLSMIGKDQEISHDNIFHTVLGCLGVSADKNGINEKLNLCAD